MLLLRTLLIALAGGFLAITFANIKASYSRADDALYAFLYREGRFDAKVVSIESRNEIMHFWKTYDVKTQEGKETYRVTVPIYGASRIDSLTKE